MSKRPDWATYEPTAHVELVMGRRLADDEITYVWEFDDEGLAVCVLQHYPEVRGGFDNPSHPEDCTLTCCYVGDTDIETLLSRDQRRRVERMALDELQRERRAQECADFDSEDA